MKINYLAYIWLFILFSCGPYNPKKDDNDTVNTGTIKIAADESLQLLTESEVEAFLTQRPNADIKMQFADEKTVMEKLMKNEVELVIVSRDFSPKERKSLKKEEIIPKSFPFARSGVALVVNQKLRLEELKFEDLRNILKGKITKWNELNDTLLEKKIKVVFDHQYSGNARMLRENLLNNKNFNQKVVFAAKSTKEVIDLVKKDESTLGVLGMSWISDVDDKKSMKMRENLRILAISKPFGSDSTHGFYLPSQAYLKTKIYPLTKTVYVLHRSHKVGLAFGFTNFLTKQKGQLVILKHGLGPTNPPTRIIELREEELK